VAVSLVSVVFINLILFGTIGVAGVRFAQRETSVRLQKMALALAAVCASFVLGAITRLLFVASAAGWIDVRMNDAAIGIWQLVQAVGVTAIGVAGVITLRRLARDLSASDRVARAVSERLTAGRRLDDFGLTKREHEVLECIHGGSTSDQEIADSLFIAASTAGTHVKNVMRKTGVKSRRELVFFVDAVGS
jgi:DNA-binding CsgD family transcriptional regulator